MDLHVRTTTAALLAALLAPALSRAQTFDSGSTGSDGALAIPPNAGVLVFDPTTFDPPLDPDGDNVYHFTTISVGVNTTLRLSTRTLPEGKPVVWLASGAVVIDGTLDLEGENGHAAGGLRGPAVAGAGGYSGGVGRTGAQPAAAGNGPGGGGPNGAAGHTITPAGSNPGTAYGNEFLLPLLGGSGGGGGVPATGGGSGAGGGGGGGAILIGSSAAIVLNGSIDVRGGATGTAGAGSVRGGNGSGGAVRLIAPSLSGGGSINAAAGSSGGTVTASHGRVRLEAFRHVVTYPVTPGAALMPLAAPGRVFLPATAPAIRVVRVAGQAVAMSPTGSFVTPDVTIDAPATVTVELEARHVPLGTVLNLTFQPETGAPFTATSTPLSGTVELSTATVQAQFPHGPTRVFVKATWTP